MEDLGCSSGNRDLINKISLMTDVPVFSKKHIEDLTLNVWTVVCLFIYSEQFAQQWNICTS